jgi:hypothetical protein
MKKRFSLFSQPADFYNNFHKLDHLRPARSAARGVRSCKTSFGGSTGTLLGRPSSMRNVTVL